MNRTINPTYVFAVVIVWKIVLFAMFQQEYHDRGYFKMEGLMSMAGDAPGYLEPTRAYIEEDAVIDACRLPGFLPIYGPLLAFFGDTVAKNTIVILHLLTDIFSVWFLGRIAFLLFRRRAVQNLTLLLYGFSSFNSVYAHCGFGEIFHLFLLILGVWAFLRFQEHKKLHVLVFAGAALTWSLFFRQITIVPYGIIGVFFVLGMLFNGVPFRLIVRRALAFAAPVVLVLGVWTAYNFYHHQRFIPLAKRSYECFETFPAHKSAIFEVVSGFGGDWTYWGKEGKWFHDPSIPTSRFPFSNRVFTNDYDLTTLDSLRVAFKQSLTMDRDDPAYAPLVDEILGIGDRVTTSYKREKPLDFYLFNRLRLTRDFLFPTRLDNLPFPARDEMATWQFGFKAGALLFLLITNALGAIGLVLRKWGIHHTVVLSIVGFLIYLGLIEQRYFAPAHPFMLISAAYMLSLLTAWISRRFSA